MQIILQRDEIDRAIQNYISETYSLTVDDTSGVYEHGESPDDLTTAPLVQYTVEVHEP